MKAKFKSTETLWHKRWKTYYQTLHGAQLEVRIGSHVCDALLPNGQIIEVQRKPLPYGQLVARELEYQSRLTWLYSSEFVLNRIDRKDWVDLIDLPIDERFRFVGKISSIVYHKEPVWVEHDNIFYRLWIWEYEGCFYGKFKERRVINNF